MKHPTPMGLGYARRNRNSGRLDWSYLVKKFPLYREHIMRVRRDVDKLYGLRAKLEVTHGKGK
jgi:hypothetical protein